MPSILAQRRGISKIPALKVTRKTACLTEMRLDSLYEKEMEETANLEVKFYDVPNSPLLPIREVHFNLPIDLDLI
jgi:hypothetical protein